MTQDAIDPFIAIRYKLQHDRQFIPAEIAVEWALMILQAYDKAQLTIADQQRELDARANILNHNVKVWQEMFPLEVGNSWYYPADKVKEMVDDLRSQLQVYEEHYPSLVALLEIERRSDPDEDIPTNWGGLA